MSADGITILTPREREVLTLIAEGDSLVEIAHKLHRSLKTVESHRLSLGRKLKASNRVELAKIAIANGLITIGNANHPVGSDSAPSDAELRLSLLDQINTALGNATGAKLLERFCRAASQLPGIQFAGICTVDPDQGEQGSPLNRLTVAMCEGGSAPQSLRYNALDTPCQQVVEQGECIVAENVQLEFPKDPWLKEIDASSYFGIKLIAANGESVGGVGMLGKEPIKDVSAVRGVLDFFAPRLSGALQHMLELNRLKSQRDVLESVLTDASRNVVNIQGDAESGLASIALGQITRRVHHQAGAAFLRGIVDAFCDTFGMSFAGICRLEQGYAVQHLRTQVFRAHGELGDDFEYKTEYTPCEIALREGHYSVPSGAMAKFPKDQILLESNIDSYIGVRLPAPSGQIAGLLWLACEEPITEDKVVLEIAKYFAPRIGSELDHHLRLEELLQDRERLEAELQQLQ